MPELDAQSLRRFKPYPAYKDSGVEWLGEIPAHWEVRRLKSIATVHLSNVDKKSVEGQRPVKLCNYTDVYYNERITADMDFMTATATREQVRRFALRAGDVLITKDSESWTDIAVPAVICEDLPDVLCGYHLALIRPANEIVGAFLSRAFSAIGSRDQFQVAANGITRFGLNGDAIRTGVFAIPPEPEQHAIAAFLDRETAKIDALVAKKERLIELQQEKRTALITRAVTQGLDPTVPMKDSGVEWLGQIPAHWEVRRLRFAVALNPVPTGAVKLPKDAEVSFVPMEAIGEYGGLDLRQTKSLGEIGTGYTYFADGDVIVAKITPCFENGKGAFAAGLTNGSAFGTTELHVLRPRDGLDRRYLFYGTVQPAFRRLGEAEMYGAGGQKRVPESFVENFRHPIPPINEQHAIAAFLDRETAKIDALIAKVREAIERLKEYRTALISAAVTGKIDVREEVAG
ncbi:MAG: restriction endonuclease subunit S [Casimicrobiaceae bacterium]|nr:restriction endonuclease subunit S [Casimicrobiaceae bacterium]